MEWNIELLKDAPNPVGTLRSKAVGEPPLIMSYSAVIAVQRAVESAKADRGIKGFVVMRKCRYFRLFNRSLCNTASFSVILITP